MSGAADPAERIASALERIATAMEKMEEAPDPINVVQHIPAPAAPASVPDQWSSIWDMMQAMNPMMPRRPQ